MDFLSSEDSHPIISEARQYILFYQQLYNIMRKIFVLHEKNKDLIRN